HLRICQERLIVVDELEFLGLGKRLNLRRFGVRGACDESNLVAVLLNGFDQRFSPPAETYNRSVDHAYEVLRNENLGSAASEGVSGSPRSFFTMLTPCTSDTIL